MGIDDNIKIAFCHNDLGNYSSYAFVKKTWANMGLQKILLKDGYMLSNNNFNRAKIDNEGMMKREGFEILQFQNLKDVYDLF